MDVCADSDAQHPKSAYMCVRYRRESAPSIGRERDKEEVTRLKARNRNRRSIATAA